MVDKLSLPGIIYVHDDCSAGELFEAGTAEHLVEGTCTDPLVAGEYIFQRRVLLKMGAIVEEAPKPQCEKKPAKKSPKKQTKRGAKR